MTITANITTLNRLITLAEKKHHRPVSSVRLLAVSKQQSTKAIAEAFDAGVRDFGENYVQEAIEKIKHFSHEPIHWHFIGNVQSNKIKTIAQHFHWVHTVTTPQIAKKLNAARPVDCPPLQVCIQLKMSDEKNKTGIHSSEAMTLAKYITTLPNLTLRGLMVIPKSEMDSQKQYTTFFHVSACLQHINETLQLSLDTLSMGMSQDFEAAIRAGSTMVRMGTAIFGRRP